MVSETDYEKALTHKEFQIRRNYKKYEMLYKWIKLKQRDVRIETFFEDFKIETIAIYGMGDLGILLYDELKESSVKILYGLDKNPRECCGKLEVYNLDRSLMKPDAIVITLALICDEIENMIFNTIGECTVFTLEEILYELEHEY